MNSETHVIVGIGEILWDLLPGGKVLGGAPANFAFHCSMLGQQGIIVSRVGRDSLGETIVKELEGKSLSTDYLQLDREKPTGTVHVSIDRTGQPSYRITEEVAWDYLEYNESLKLLAARTNAVCFGTLGQRLVTAQKTIQQFVQQCPPGTIRVLDVNLRQDYYSADLLKASLELASVVKLNNEELPLIASLLLGQEDANELNSAMALLREFHLDLICVTRGAKGCLLLTPESKAEIPGVVADVQDTVGAGDAFTAALVYHYLNGSPLEIMADRANRMGAAVASQKGATPQLPQHLIQEIKAC